LIDELARGHGDAWGRRSYLYAAGELLGDGYVRLHDYRFERRHEQRDRVRECGRRDRKSTRLNSSHRTISYAVFCLKKKNTLEVTSSTSSQIRPLSLRPWRQTTFP